MSVVFIEITDEKLAPEASKGGQLLRDLCRKEVDNFDQYLRQQGKEYADGLAKFERLAIEGYLYQKIRGRLNDAKESMGDLPVWREDGSPGSNRS